MNHSLPRRITTLATVLLGFLAVGACGQSEEPPGAAPAGQPGAPNVRLVSAGKIKTCTNLPYPPFQFKEGDRTVGFDVDMIDLAARRMNVTQEIVDVKFDIIKSGAALNAGTCDVAAAGMTITEERRQNLDFTDPYFDEVLSLLVKKGSGISSLDDVKSKNLKVGVQTGTTSLDMARQNGITPTEFDDSGKLLLALQSNQVDVALQDLPVVIDWLKRPEIADRLERATELETGKQYGFAVKKGTSAELLAVLNESIKAAIGDGTWARLYQQWMGSEPKSTPAVR